ncbi:hypothetical protein DPX16_16094 [Anabarilius grahami]|uniref:Uncharacterized protein n=1 Tax=Anabarilius grahami TaxID=495550 RepID=A0A3N0YNE1_ANAGA|nr:hypothetical protein DPX16_16094 [Anabarilius grahami]
MLRRRPIGPTLVNTWHQQVATHQPVHDHINHQAMQKPFTHYLEKECTLRRHTLREACLRPTQQRWGVADGGMGSRIPRHPAKKSAKKGGPCNLSNKWRSACLQNKTQTVPA